MTGTRKSAVDDLIASLKITYPEKGFSCHPSLAFKEDPEGGGLSARAATNIAKDTVLLVIPHSARLRASAVNTLADDKRWGLPSLLSKVLKKCNRALGAENYQGTEEFELAVLAMRARSLFEAGQTDILWSKQAATWPSKEELRNMFVYWDESQLDLVGRNNMGFLRNQIAERQKLLRQLFDGTIYPLLEEHSERFIVPSTAGQGLSTREALWESFLYGFSIVYSRSHDGEKEKPELLPLVELFNGTDEGGKINVSLACGKWPFIRGGVFINECNLSCSAVYATQDIKEGEELIISYGDLHPSQFIIKYGMIPSEMLARRDMVDKVDLYCPPELVPSMNDALRVEALEHRNGFPLEELKKGDVNFCHLDRDTFLSYQSGYEGQDIASVRQFLVLSKLADDDAVRLNIRTGRLRCNINQRDLCSLMCRVIDYSIEILGVAQDNGVNTSSAGDVNRASGVARQNPAEAAALLGRACQRETLTMWRHLICRNYNVPSHVNVSAAQLMQTSASLNYLSDGGCRVCGRTYPLQTCARCKWIGPDAAQYCCREHQKLDWKGHKQECKAK